MKKKLIIILFVLIIIIIIIFIARYLLMNTNHDDLDNKEETIKNQNVKDDFQIDLVYQVGDRDIHYSAYIPENINELDKVNMFITLPGWEGLYFQGVGVNLEYEDFAYTARDIDPNMIILAPQLDDWGQQSASDTIALTKYYQENYPKSY